MLDLGAVVARIIVEDASGRQILTEFMALMRSVSTEAGTAAQGTAKLDGAFAGVASSADKATSAVGRSAQASAKSASADEKAAATAKARADAQTKVTATMAETATESTRVQQATLRQLAANERLAASAAQVGSSEARTAAETARLASAQASAIGASDRLAAAQTRVAETTAEATAATGRWRLSMGDMIKTAGSLGLVLGAFEAVKAAIDIGKQAADYQRSMTMVQNLTGASTDEVNTMSKALLGMSGKVAQSPADLAIAFYHAASVGMHTAQAFGAVKDAAEAAGIGNADLEDTMNALTAVVASGIGKNQSYAKSMSQILTIVGAGDMKLSDFNSTLSSGVLAVVKTYGITLRDFGAAMAVFGDQNVRGTHAATMFRMSVQSLAVPMASGAQLLAQMHLSTDAFAKDMERGGLLPALTDLKTHLNAIGISGNKMGAALTDIFGKRAGPGLAVLLAKMNDGLGNIYSKYALLDDKSQTLSSRWAVFTKTASYEFKSLADTINADAVAALGNLTPKLGVVASMLTGSVKGAIAVVSDALHPFVVAWEGVASLLPHIGGELSGMSGALGPVGHVLAGITSAVLAMWLAFRGFVIIRAVIGAVADLGAALTVKMVNGAVAVRNLGTSFGVAATEAEGSAASIAASADAAATGVAGAADTAKIGWAGIAGPIGLAAIGVMTLVSWFHKSSTASKEAADAAQAYTQALQGGGGPGGNTILGTIVEQMYKNDIPDHIEALNTAMGRTAVSGTQFINAVQHGGAALITLRQGLSDTVAEGDKVSASARYAAAESLTLSAKQAAASQQQRETALAAGQAAKTLLADLNAQYGGLTKAAEKELAAWKTTGHAASSIDKISQSTRLATQTAQTYAAMMGFVADKNGIVAASSQKVKDAVLTVKQAYAGASETEGEFLSALQTFSGSAGTAADRAALIGATLKAANGDTLNYETQINAAASATRQFASDVHQAAGQVGKNGESTKAYLDSLVNLKTGTIDYHRSAAGPLLSDLGSMQAAAMNAAEAQYQHAKQTVGAAKAAQEAYQVYRSQTSGALIDEATKLGLTQGQAKKLSDTYFGMPKNVKTAIVAEGTDPILTVLNKIGQLLANFTGQRWDIKVSADVSAAMARVNALQGVLNRLHAHGISNQQYENIARGIQFQPQAAGTRAAFGSDTIPPNTAFTVGEAGWEGGVTDSQGRASIFPASVARAIGFRAPVSYAKGTNPSLLSLASRYRDWNPRVMAAIAEAESSGNAHALNNNPSTGDLSYGLWQINMIGSLGAPRRREFGISSDSALFNPQTNVRAAHDIWRDQGYDAWSTYNSGAYQQYLGDDGQIESGRGSAYHGRRARYKREHGIASRLTDQRASYESAQHPNKVIHAGGQWYLGGQGYASQREAKLAQAQAQAQAEQQRAQQFAQQLRTFGHSTDTVRDANQAFHPLIRELRRAGLGDQELNRLDRENTHLDKLIRRRNKLADEAQADHKKWVAAVQHMHADARSFTQAARSGFDITTAGQDANGKFSLGRLGAQQSQYLNLLRKWIPDFKKIVPLFDETPSGVTMLRELAGGDPMQTYAEVHALASSPKFDKQLLSTQRQIAKLTSGFGGDLSRVLDLPTAKADRAQLREDKRAEERTKREITHAVKEMGRELGRDFNEAFRGASFEMEFKGGVWRAVQVEGHHHKRHRHNRKTS